MIEAGDGVGIINGIVFSVSVPCWNVSPALRGTAIIKLSLELTSRAAETQDFCALWTVACVLLFIGLIIKSNSQGVLLCYGAALGVMASAGRKGCHLRPQTSSCRQEN